ncbi:hypothetical protein RRG08_022552 [Elysia crispata]|uniref:Uncharacterized protein n=1 Tax=Elysia crispata TaxID=231223 RepID=A0AAE0Z1M3_9GAST|nr:hypothetical protein RRG08_022552 [Elysia crispata]
MRQARRQRVGEEERNTKVKPMDEFAVEVEPRSPSVASRTTREFSEQPRSGSPANTPGQWNLAVPVSHHAPLGNSLSSPGLAVLLTRASGTSHHAPLGNSPSDQ